MPARKPEDCDILLIEAAHKGDLETAVALYEPNASFVLDSGEIITERAAIREALQDHDASIRMLALELLAQRGVAGKPGISLALSDSDPAIRAHAQEMWEQIGAAE